MRAGLIIGRQYGRIDTKKDIKIDADLCKRIFQEDAMTAVKGTTIKTEFKRICERAIEGETFIVTRPRDENIVIISEKEYRQLLRAKAYADHLSSGQGFGLGAEDTYPRGFFELFGAGRSLEFGEKDMGLSFENDVKREEL